jgi:hypothetical protein
VLLPSSRTVALWFENLPGTTGLHVAHWSCWAFAQAPSHEPSFCGATFSSPASSVIPWERRTASMPIRIEDVDLAPGEIADRQRQIYQHADLPVNGTLLDDSRG